MPRTTTTTERTVRAVTHATELTDWHLYRSGSEHTLCGLVIPVRGVTHDDARKGDCPDCVRLHVDESLAKHQNGASPPEGEEAEPPAFREIVDATTGEITDHAYPVCEQAESGQMLPTIVEAPPRAVTVPGGGSGYEKLRGHFRATLEKYQLKHTDEGPELVIQLTVAAGATEAVALNLPRLLHGLVEVTLTGEGRKDAGKQLALWGEG